VRIGDLRQAGGSAHSTFRHRPHSTAAAVVSQRTLKRSEAPSRGAQVAGDLQGPGVRLPAARPPALPLLRLPPASLASPRRLALLPHALAGAPQPTRVCSFTARARGGPPPQRAHTRYGQPRHGGGAYGYRGGTRNFRSTSSGRSSSYTASDAICRTADLRRVWWPAQRSTVDPCPRKCTVWLLSLCGCAMVWSVAHSLSLSSPPLLRSSLCSTSPGVAAAPS
jgi:hypothetical protein